MKIPKILLAAAMGLAATLYAEKPVLKIAYSDWPGWTAWEIADKKGFFKTRREMSKKEFDGRSTATSVDAARRAVSLKAETDRL